MSPDIAERLQRAIASRRGEQLNATTQSPSKQVVVSENHSIFSQPVKPHTYKLTIGIPHLGVLDTLKVSVALWRSQTVKPYFSVVDTGSSWPVCEYLEKEFRKDDCEVHFIRSHGTRSKYELSSSALDLLVSRCQTEYLLYASSTSRAKNNDFLDILISNCSPNSPIVGISKTLPNEQPKLSKDILLIHVPTIRRYGISWSTEIYYSQNPTVRIDNPNVLPEECFLHSVTRTDIKPVLLIDSNNNIENTTTETIVQDTGSIECVHRGEQVDSVVCGPCGGRVQLKVFSCKIHGRCVINKAAEGAKTCNSCQDKKSR